MKFLTFFPRSVAARPPSGAFVVFGDNCQKELRNLGDMPVDMRGGGIAKINSDG